MDYYLTFHTIGRDPDYLELNKRFTIDIFKASYILNMFPPILKPYALHDCSP